MESKICAFPSPQSIKDESPATDSINELVLQTSSLICGPKQARKTKEWVYIDHIFGRN